VSLVRETPNPEQVVVREAVIPSEPGLHARPASAFVKLASKFESEIWVGCDNDRVNGKSIIGLLTLAAGKGVKIAIEAEGKDAKAAVEALVLLVKADFQAT
jgi:phosphocarrier protein|tara:strand:- start:914 stop:1216 length:303 start_codon:yes stop_codon:yes gene_type:complete